MSIADDQARIDALLRTLQQAYDRASDRIQAELQAVADEERQARRRRRLRELQVEVNQLRADLDSDVRSWVSDEFRIIYELGATTAAADMGVGFSWTQTHRAAVRVMAEATMRDMLAATKHVSADVKKLVRASSREATLMKLLTGQTAVQAGRGLAAELSKNAVSAITYRNGARHTLADYSEMNLRTVSAIAYNKGTIIEAKQQRAKYAIAYDGPACGLTSHEDGRKANNLILPLGQAMQYLIAHPRCRRAWSPLPDIRSKQQAEAAMEEGLYATTAQQDAAQRAADAVRTAAQRNTARKTARQRRIAARAAKVRAA